MIAKKETPTSAKTAAHIVAIPSALNIKTHIFTAIAKIIFSFTEFCLTI